MFQQKPNIRLANQGNYNNNEIEIKRGLLE